jgi:hypothetical protein
MRVYSYVVTHDYGFAPNPFNGMLTLATCKPKIRAQAAVGDWVMGTGSASRVGRDRLIFAGCISEVVSLAEYGSSERFQSKIPRAPSAECSLRGDNIYFRSASGQWSQRRNPFHGKAEMKHDISGSNVLVCEQFWYFGSNAKLIPERFMSLVKKGPAHKHNAGNPAVPAFLTWLQRFEPGRRGEPSGLSHNISSKRTR